MRTLPATKVAALTTLVLLVLGVALGCGSPPPSNVAHPTSQRVARPTLEPAATVTAMAVPMSPVAARPTRLSTPVADPGPRFVVRAGKGGPAIHASPDEKSASLAGLYFDTYLPVYVVWSDASGVVWYQVRLWGVLTGWIRADQTETGDPPPPTPRPVESDTASSVAPQRPPSGVLTLTARGVATDWANLRDGPSSDSDRIDLLAPGTPLAVHAWQTDADASAWYQVSVGSETGW
ncbi:MAG: SH3 domain-containing protein, partial [Candidatus Dormibacteraceae bacterium]